MSNKCIHCNKQTRLPGGVHCRICTLGGRARQLKLGETKPWWEWPSYGEIDWHSYLSALVAELQVIETPLALPSRAARGAWLPPAAIQILRDDILRSSAP